jgi:3-(3-hydroxy-phenyl)propionate hydroxylase
LLCFGETIELPGVHVLQVGTDVIDAEGLLAERYAVGPEGAVLIRPDQHVAARWRRPTREAAQAALRRATCR